MIRLVSTSSNYPHSADPRNGNVVFRLIKEIDRNRYRLTHVAPRPWVPPGLSRLGGRFVPRGSLINVEADFEVIRPGYFRMPRAMFPRAVGVSYAHAVKRSLQEENDVDIFLAHMAFPEGDACRRISSCIGKPYVVTIRNSDLIKCRNSSLYKDIVRHVVSDARSIVVPSVSIKNKVESRFGVHAHFVPNGFDPFVLQSKEPSCKTRVLSIGRLLPTKGIDTTIRAAAKLSEIRGGQIELRIAGDGPDRARLERLIVQLGCEQRVTLLGSLSRDEVGQLLRWADIMCLPSTEETFGLVYLEALSAGVPIIGCRGQGVCGTIPERKGIRFVQPGSVLETVEAISGLEAQPLNFNDRQSLASIASGFSWENAASAYEKIIQDSVS